MVVWVCVRVSVCLGVWVGVGRYVLVQGRGAGVSMLRRDLVDNWEPREKQGN